MKRVVFSVVCTILGLVALLSFKSQTNTTIGGTLPSATLSSSAPATAASPSPASSAASGPPDAAQPSPTQTVPAQSSRTSPTPAPSSSASATKSQATPKTYDGSAVQTRYGTVQVAVTVVGKKITNVAFLQLTSHDGRSADINNQAAPILLQETLSAQSGNIDSVSGASFTSAGYLQSLQSALDQAGIA
jgi:uncharacterized protein with FMN-binding domain